MKVKIGPYINWIGPYQIADALTFWVKKVPDEYGFLDKPEWVFNKFGRWLAEDKNGNDSWLMKFCSWLHSKRKRKIKIHIDKYDTWNMNRDLSYIILPLLKKLKEEKHGSPLVDDEDVPEELRSYNGTKENYIDSNWHKRWDWVLDEMIWAFEQLQIDWEEQYMSEISDLKTEPCSTNEQGNSKEYKFIKGPDHTLKIDLKGMEEHFKRIRRGTSLFGKYYIFL